MPVSMHTDIPTNLHTVSHILHNDKPLMLSTISPLLKNAGIVPKSELLAH